MSIPEYRDYGPVDISADLDTQHLARKSVIVTGGANGLGKAYVEAFVTAGAFVTIADYNDAAGKIIEAELSPNVIFLRCDVRDWNDQVAVFEAAISSSPEKSIDVVITNAGIIGQDDVFSMDDPTLPPVKPSLKMVEVNLIGTIYTAKLAMHYFRRQPTDPARDRCIIIKGSIAAYVDQPGSPQYNVSKWGVRGLFRNLRRTAWREGIRVNFVAPWFVRTPIFSHEIAEILQSKGVEFATVEDGAQAVLQIASRKEINGRALGVVPRQEASEGFVDLAHDDYQEGDFMKGWQEIVLKTAQSIVD